MTPDRTQPPIPVVVCIDAEPDGFFIDHERARPWTGFARAVDFFQDLRARMASGTSVAPKFTWFLKMDPQIEEVYGSAAWPAEHYADDIASLTRDGDEVGLHVHAYRWDRVANAWIVDHDDATWIAHCLAVGVAAFERTLRRRPVTFRFGDRWMSNAALGELSRSGIRYDATLEPGQPALSTYHPRERSTGALPDYSMVPRTPYLPSSRDFRRPRTEHESGPDVWLLPVTSAPVRARWTRELYYRTFRRHAPTHVWSGLASHDPLLFRRIVEWSLGQGLPHLALPVRTDVLATPRLARRLAQNLAWLQQHPLAGRFVWTTPEGAIRRIAPTPQSSRGAP